MGTTGVVDTVKHMDIGATRYFASVMHEFAESLGKDHFYLIGKITGGRASAFKTRAITGLDAALGIDDVQDKLEYLIKGYRNPSDYFGLFANSVEVDEAGNQWLRDIVVTQIDDQDQVRKGSDKARFCAGGSPVGLPFQGPSDYQSSYSGNLQHVLSPAIDRFLKVWRAFKAKQQRT